MGKLMAIAAAVFFVVTSLGCGGGDPESKIVLSKEDRLQYIADMEALEGKTGAMMNESPQVRATE